MRIARIAVLLLAVVTAQAQPSYWFRQWQVKPDAQQAQAFFMVPGTGVTFTYATNRVIINALGGGTNYYYTNTYYVTNYAYYTNNYYYTNLAVGLTTNFDVIFVATGLTNTLYFTNGLLAAITPSSVPAHCPSLVQPGGGYLLQPIGGTLCLP